MKKLGYGLLAFVPGVVLIAGLVGMIAGFIMIFSSALSGGNNGISPMLVLWLGISDLLVEVFEIDREEAVKNLCN